MIKQPEVLQENHYYPFGMTIAPLSQSPENGENKYPYNGKEHHADFGLHWTDYGARWSDAQLGRWHSVDPLAEDVMQIDKSPYAYAWNNPVYYTDPDGRCPWCIGAIVGAAIDYGTQVAVNYATGNENPLTDVDTKSIAVSAAAGATGVGLVAKAGKIFNGRTLKAAEMAIDGTVNSVQQYVNKGEVDLKRNCRCSGFRSNSSKPTQG